MPKRMKKCLDANALVGLRKLLKAYKVRPRHAKDVVDCAQHVGPIEDRSVFVRHIWNGVDRFHDGVWDALETFFREVKEGN